MGHPGEHTRGIQDKGEAPGASRLDLQGDIFADVVKEVCEDTGGGKPLLKWEQKQGEENLGRGASGLY